MSDQLPLLMGVGFALVALLITYVKHIGYVESISTEITKKGFRPIAIQRRWLDYHKNTATYDVEYQDDYGHGYQTSCKIHSLFIFFDGRLYWTKPLMDRDGDRMKRDMTRQLLIDSLRKENKQLKDKIKELEAINNELRGIPPKKRVF